MRVEKWAMISDDGRFRHVLGRRWMETKPYAIFSLLNPSKADATIEDPTSRRLLGFALVLGYGGYVLTNLSGYRATSPKDMHAAWARGDVAEDAARNQAAIQAVIENERSRRQQLYDRVDVKVQVICGWGNHGRLGNMSKTFIDFVEKIWSVQLQCFDVTKEGQPKHPLYLPADAKPRDWHPWLEEIS